MPRGVAAPAGFRREDSPKTYDSWRAAQRRCTDPKHKDYPKYGGSDVTFSEDWLHNYVQFFTDMGPRPEGHTLDRINVFEGYSADNCRWADAKTQRLNQRSYYPNVKVA